MAPLCICLEPGCSESFPDRWELREHSRKNHPHLFRYACNILDCTVPCSDSDSLLRHKRCYHVNYTCRCPGCDGTFAKPSDVIDHRGIHSERSVKCEFQGCARTYQVKEQMNHHQRSVHGIFGCDYPGCIFTSKGQDNLNMHKLRDHSSRLRDHEKNKWPPHYVCDHTSCRARFSKQVAVGKHRKEVHGILGDIICPYPQCMTQLDSKDDIRQHIQVVHPRIYRCEYWGCKLPYYSAHDLAQHRETHHTSTDSLICSCPQGCCTAKYDCANKLIQHIQTAHPKAPIRCDSTECTASYDTVSDLMRHKKKKHPFENSASHFDIECDMFFSTQEAFEEHLFFAHSAKMMMCKAFNCTAYFLTVMELEMHRADAHSQLISCNDSDCSSTFNTTTEYRRHNQFLHSEAVAGEETDMSCDYEDCSMTFRNMPQLSYHMYVAHGAELSSDDMLPREYLCGKLCCEKSFPSKILLFGHMQTDHIQRPCPFRDCSATFLSSASIRLHIRDKDIHPESIECTARACSGRFDDDDKFQEHLQMHGISPYLCNHKQCGVTFDTLARLFSHEANAHRRSRCEVCLQTFSGSTGCIVHACSDHGHALSCGNCQQLLISASAVVNHFQGQLQDETSTSVFFIRKTSGTASNKPCVINNDEGCGKGSTKGNMRRTYEEEPSPGVSLQSEAVTLRSCVTQVRELLGNVQFGELSKQHNEVWRISNPPRKPNRLVDKLNKHHKGRHSSAIHEGQVSGSLARNEKIQARLDHEDDAMVQKSIQQPISTSTDKPIEVAKGTGHVESSDGRKVSAIPAPSTKGKPVTTAPVSASTQTPSGTRKISSRISSGAKRLFRF